MSGGDDLSLTIPWLHISTSLLEIKAWLRRDVQKVPEPQPEFGGSLGRRRTLGQYKVSGNSRELMQGIYCVLERMLPSTDIEPAKIKKGNQMCVLLGFRQGFIL